ncbi:PHP domain-containing protein [Butyrivibrio sp. AE2032]|uniref:PHP domain-containing protein n=1 Tax=Butyrivibrio sp. AE2032 TaxID=1458463 RepID=UPI0006902A26|nr:PHP domain-containing protein [Butyrivibrio sp. AE2032]
MGFLYETHLHTCEASACGKVHGEEYIPYLMDKGFSGIIVTDHFFNGNTCVPENLPWKERVEIYASGYERALKAAEGKDFNVMFGVEFNFIKDEYLLYGIDKQWLLDNECIMEMTRHELFEAVHKAGGIMIQAHPYRERDYLSDIKLAPTACDGVEVYNAANKPNMNALGYEYCTELGLPMTAGSDIHFFYEGDMGGMLFEKKLGSIADYVTAIKERSGVPVRLSADGTITPVAEIKEQTVPTGLPTLPVLYPEGK